MVCFDHSQWLADNMHLYSRLGNLHLSTKRCKWQPKYVNTITSCSWNERLIKTVTRHSITWTYNTATEFGKLASPCGTIRVPPHSTQIIEDGHQSPSHLVLGKFRQLGQDISQTTTTTSASGNSNAQKDEWFVWEFLRTNTCNRFVLFSVVLLLFSSLNLNFEPKTKYTSIYVYVNVREER